MPYWRSAYIHRIFKEVVNPSLKPRGYHLSLESVEVEKDYLVLMVKPTPDKKIIKEVEFFLRDYLTAPGLSLRNAETGPQ
jgi:hypothetical protein